MAYKAGPGPSGVSGPDGRYDITGVEAVHFQLQATKDGYESATGLFGPPSGDTTIDLALTPVLRTLTGVVTETPPSETTPIADATVEVLTGSNKGKKVTTDGSGSYTLPGVWGDFDVSISRESYDEKTVRVSIVSTVTRLDVALLPDAQPVRTAFTGRLCADVAFWLPNAVPLPPPYNCIAYPLQGHHFIPIHRAGTIEIDFQWRYEEDYSAEYFWLEVRCGSTMVEQLYELHWNGLPIMVPGRDRGPLRISVSSPSVCEFKPLRYRSFKGHVAWTEYQLEITHPK